MLSVLWTFMIPFAGVLSTLSAAGGFFMAAMFSGATFHVGDRWIPGAIAWAVLILLAGGGLTFYAIRRHEKSVFESVDTVPPPWWTRTRSRILTVVSVIAALLAPFFA